MKLQRIALVLVVGILVTYSVAWVCFAWSPTLDMASLEAVPEDSPYYAPDTPTLAYKGRTDAHGLGWTVRTEFYDRANSGFAPLQTHTPLDSARAGLPFYAFQANERLVIDRALSQNSLGPVWVYDTSWGARVRSGIPIDSSYRSEWLPTYLPVAPQWPGFLINTLFYASLAWGFSTFIARLIKQSRVRRGLCPKCKYELATLPTCPECNTPAPPRTIPQ